MKPRKPTPGSPENKMTLTLSTGYDVELDLLDARPGLEHLARALMGKVMLPKLKRALKAAEKRKAKAGGTPRLLAVRKEILNIIDKMESEDLRLLVIAVMWAYLSGEFEKIESREASTN
jgi:hypothetical protein